MIRHATLPAPRRSAVRFIVLAGNHHEAEQWRRDQMLGRAQVLVITTQNEGRGRRLDSDVQIVALPGLYRRPPAIRARLLDAAELVLKFSRL